MKVTIMITIERHDRLHVSTSAALIIVTLPKYRARALIYDRVDFGPRDLRRLDGIQRLLSVHVACKR